MMSHTSTILNINEIERLVNSIEKMGVYINGVKVSVIMYADDLVLITKKQKADLHDELQKPTSLDDWRT